MDSDLALIIGLIIAGLSVPAIISAISEARAPRAAAITILIGGGLIVFAVTSNPGGYAMADIPDVFFRVVGRYVN